MAFIDETAALALSGTVAPDPDALTWAARAFSVIAILGSIEDEVGIQGKAALRELLAKAPGDVLTGGTIALEQAVNSSGGGE